MATEVAGGGEGAGRGRLAGIRGRAVGTGANLLQQRKWADAESVLREALALLESKGPEDGRSQRPVVARRRPHGSGEVRRGRAAADPGVRGAQGPRGADPAADRGTASPRPASESSGSTRPGAGRSRPPNGGRSSRVVRAVPGRSRDTA